MLAKLSEILGHSHDVARYNALAEEIKKAYTDNFVDPNTGVCDPDTQASQSFALFLDMLRQEQRPAALKVLLDDISTHNGHLTTGIFGTRYMLDLLSQEGFGQTAYDIVNQRTYPGWGHMLENGATTLWEHWSFSDNTFSHNHPMFGSVSQWFYNWLSGIQMHPDAVGSDHIIIRPQIPNGLDWVQCTYDSVRGKISSNWRKTGGVITIDIEIPANAVATVYLPSSSTDQIMESNRPVDGARGVEFVRCENQSAIYNLQSGKYQFVLPYKLTE
jgi:alpha-L-rhamnosidase